MRSLLALVFLVGCGASEREVEIVNALPGCLGGATVDAIEVQSLGDFAPQSSTAAPGSTMRVPLPGGTRVVEIDGRAASSLVAFGRSAPFFLGALGERVAVHYGPPNALCATGRMRYARAGHRATLLLDGSVMLSGGWDADGFAVPKLELYAAGSFRVVDPTGPTAIDARAAAGHAVVRLPSGRLVVTGGAPVSNARPNGIATEGMLRLGVDGVQIGAATLVPGGPRAFHTASALPDGRVLLLGGCAEFAAGECVAGGALDGAVLFDSDLGGVSEAPKLRRARWGHQAIARGDGTFLVVGGRGEGALFPPPEIYDPSAPRGLDAGTVSAPAAKLPTGTVLAVGGGAAASTEVTAWLGATEAETSFATLPSPRSGHTVTTLEDGAVLVAGGGGSTTLDGALLILDGQGAITSVPGGFSRRQHTATLLDDGAVLLAGGEDGRGSTTETAIFLRSPLGPFSSLPVLAFDGAAEPLAPRRPDRAQVSGQLIVDAPARGEGGRPGELVLVAGPSFGDFSLAVVAEGAAALIFAHQSEAAYAFVALEVGQPAALSSLSSPGVGQTLVSELCRGEILRAGEAGLFVSYKKGSFDLYTVERTLLRCQPRPAPERGAVGLGALHGTARFDNLTITR